MDNQFSWGIREKSVEEMVRCFDSHGFGYAGIWSYQRKNITTRRKDSQIAIHMGNEERHVQNQKQSSYWMASVWKLQVAYRAVVGDVQRQDSGYRFMKKEWKNLLFRVMRQVNLSYTL